MKLSKKSVLAFFLLAISAPHILADEYHLGEGYTVGNINIAGYLNLVAESPHGGKAQLVGDDLSLFVGGRFNRYLNPFFEAEFSGATIWRESGSLFSDNHPEFVLERLYNDSNLTEHLTLRIGKMLTPVGEWNSIHAAPLVWTTTRPMTTHRSFAEYTSGLELHYTPQESAHPEIQVYWQPGRELMPRPKAHATREYQRSAGLHLNWGSGLTDKVGISLQHAQLNDNDQSQTLAGINARKTLGKLQIETEATYTRIFGQNPAQVRDGEWGAYLLGGYAINDKWSLIAHYEYFSDRNATSGSQNALLGLSWRQNPAVVWKLEYVKQRGALLDVSTGVVASLAVLF